MNPKDAHYGPDRCFARWHGGAIVAEVFLSGVTWSALPQNPVLRAIAGLTAAIVVGAISSLLGMAGGEFIPILIFMFGADIRTAGTASVLVSTPIVLTGVLRHWLTGHYRSQTMLVYLVLPSLGSLLGAAGGSYLATSAPTALRLTLAAILAVSAYKLRSKDPTPRRGDMSRPFMAVRPDGANHQWRRVPVQRS